MWEKNITGIPQGNYRTINGNADELIGIGRCIKAGFACSNVSITNGKYDAVIDLGGNSKLIRVQIKGSSNGTISLRGGGRSGQQISRAVPQRNYKYTKDDCDLILGVDSNNGECYLVPIEKTTAMGSTVSFSKLQEYKENWNILLDMRPRMLSNT